MRIPRTPWIVVALAAIATIGAASRARAEDGQAVAAARLALQRECVARETYRVDATRADEEGYASVAVLFRALAAAEDVHVRNHARALEALGVTPTTEPVRVEAGTTAANLAAAIDAEVFERRIAYAGFMAYARQECLYDVLASFRWARDAEATHAIRLALALAQLDAGRFGPAHAIVAGVTPVEARYYVCSGCGRVGIEPPARHCTCGTPSARCAVFTGPELPPVPQLLSVEE